MNVQNDPINYSDPTGNFAVALPLACAGGGCQAIAGAVCGIATAAAVAVGADQLMDKATKALERRA